MVSIICALIAGAATIVCAVVAAQGSKLLKAREKEESHARERTEEARLQLEMIAANSELTVGVALALKEGHTNGEVEKGLLAVRSASDKYTKFLEEIALEAINQKEDFR